MASSTLSDPYVAAAFWTGLGAMLLTLLLALQILYLRMALRRREQWRARTLAKWRPILNAAVLGNPPPALPSLLRQERLSFLRFWVHLQASLRGDAHDELNNIAYRLGLDSIARNMLAGSRRAERLLAALVLGYLRDMHAWPQLLRLASKDESALSLNAVWALVRINPQAAAEHMMPFFIEREDWPLSRVASILQEAREPMSRALATVLPQLDTLHLPRGLRLAEALRVPLSPELLSGTLCGESVPVMIAGLRSIITPETLDDVRKRLAHKDWQVRVQAAKALGRIGDHNDVVWLSPLLQDPNWWVRYRATQSLLSLPGVSKQDIETLQSSLSDRFAADMLAQVMAEKGVK